MVSVLDVEVIKVQCDMTRPCSGPSDGACLPQRDRIALNLPRQLTHKLKGRTFKIQCAVGQPTRGGTLA